MVLAWQLVMRRFYLEAPPEAVNLIWLYGYNCGGKLVSDDQTIIVRQEEELIMSSPENIRDKIEVRGVGIINMPSKEGARLGLVLDMMPPEKIDRIPIPQFCWYLGLQVPVLGLEPFENSAPLKVQLAINSMRSSNKYAHINTQ